MNDNWQVRMNEEIQAIKTRLAVDEIHRKNVEKRLGGIEGTLTWLMRIVVGGMLTASVIYALNGGFILR